MYDSRHVKKAVKDISIQLMDLDSRSLSRPVEVMILDSKFAAKLLMADFTQQAIEEFYGLPVAIAAEAIIASINNRHG